MTQVPNDLRNILNRFQEGYSQRDLENLDDFMRMFIDSPDLTVIGTSTTGYGEGEWCQGLEDTRELISNDWQYWGDVDYRFDKAEIAIFGDTACISSSGTVSIQIADSEIYDDFFEFTKNELERKDRSQRRKLLDIALLANEVMADLIPGRPGKYPLRFSMTLIRKDETWRIIQMHFSFPATRSPDEEIYD